MKYCMNRYRIIPVLLLSVLLLTPACKKEVVDEDKFYHDQIVGHYVAMTDEIPWLSESVDVNGDGFPHSNMSKEFCGLNGFVPAWITADIEEVERSSLSTQKFLITITFPDYRILEIEEGKYIPVGFTYRHISLYARRGKKDHISSDNFYVPDFPGEYKVYSCEEVYAEKIRDGSFTLGVYCYLCDWSGTQLEYGTLKYHFKRQ